MTLKNEEVKNKNKSKNTSRAIKENRTGPLALFKL